jgi:hypothetical protein
MKKNGISSVIFFVIFLIAESLFSQNEQHKTNPPDSFVNELRVSNGVILGVGFNNAGVAEISYGRAIFRPTKYLLGMEGHYIQKEYMLVQFYLGSEFLFDANQFMIAPKVGLNLSVSIVNLSFCNFMYYTDFKEEAYSYRPEIGLSLWGGRLFYGYNIPFTNNDFFTNYRHHVGLTWFFNIYKSEKKTIPKE